MLCPWVIDAGRVIVATTTPYAMVDSAVPLLTSSTFLTKASDSGTYTAFVVERVKGWSRHWHCFCFTDR